MLAQDEFIKTPHIKRYFDVFFSLVILIILSPLLILFLTFLLLEMCISKKARGPLLYCETRISGGKEFKFCKIRTCQLSAYEAELKKNDAIHTCNVEGDRKNFLNTGWLIKNIYMDEIPQIFSVLKGDISLVGPRP